MERAEHIPVLLKETLGLLQPQPGEVAVDGTVGLGGHALALARAVGPSGTVVGMDVDPANLQVTRDRLAATDCTFIGIRDSFVRVQEHLAAHGLRADVVLADLGFSSNQMADPARGLSFQEDGPLDMRLDPDAAVTAADLLAGLREPELARLIREYGQDPLAGKIARKLAQTRRSEPIETTAQLAKLVKQVYGRRAAASRMHPATRTFMALRIAVNDELGALRGLLEAVRRGAETVEAGGWLQDAARVAIISFHSLEDRPVKHAFADLDRRGLASRLNKRPATAGESERRSNPRSRSAKLRAVRIGGITRMEPDASGWIRPDGGSKQGC